VKERDTHCLLNYDCAVLAVECMVGWLVWIEPVFRQVPRLRLSTAGGRRCRPRLMSQTIKLRWRRCRPPWCRTGGSRHTEELHDRSIQRRDRKSRSTVRSSMPSGHSVRFTSVVIHFVHRCVCHLVWTDIIQYCTTGVEQNVYSRVPTFISDCQYLHVTRSSANAEKALVGGHYAVSRRNFFVYKFHLFAYSLNIVQHQNLNRLQCHLTAAASCCSVDTECVERLSNE